LDEVLPGDRLRKARNDRKITIALERCPLKSETSSRDRVMTNPNFEFNFSAPHEPNWKFLIGDWIMSPAWAGLIDHHMRVTNRLVDVNDQSWYQIFDTTLERGHADYEWVPAADLEKTSRIVQRPDQLSVPVILGRSPQCRGLKYSVPERLDCESLQRWIHTGKEEYRWCPQVWTLILTVAGSLAIGYFKTQPPKRRRQTYRRR
jgi:hypothetical protein